MIIRTTILLLTGLLFSITTFSQDEIQIDILPTKISTDIQMLIPSGQYLIFEKYHYFKYNYWVNAVDTLTKGDNGVLKGKNVTITPGTFSKKVGKCDTTINKIRNSALDHKLFSELDHIARREIGYDNREFKSIVNNERPSKQQVVNLCHDDFKILISKWFSTRADKIDGIKSEKLKRQERIKSNSNKVGSEYIKSFLDDYGSCETDQVAILELITRHPDEFLKVCKELSDMRFFDVKLKLSILPDYLKAGEAIAKLKASQIRTNRKGKLIRKLTKNAR